MGAHVGKGLKMTATICGGCLCGAVRYEARAAPVVAAHCQCRDCQRETGTGHSSHLGVPADSVTIRGELRYYETRAVSGATARRGFCPICGSSLLFTSSGMPDLLLLSAGSLDQPELFQPSVVVFSAQALAWDHLDPALARFAGMPQD
jgi:hypothetical protein